MCVMSMLGLQFDSEYPDCRKLWFHHKTKKKAVLKYLTPPQVENGLYFEFRVVAVTGEFQLNWHLQTISTGYRHWKQ